MQVAQSGRGRPEDLAQHLLKANGCMRLNRIRYHVCTVFCTFRSLSRLCNFNLQVRVGARELSSAASIWASARADPVLLVEAPSGLKLLKLRNSPGDARPTGGFQLMRFCSRYCKEQPGRPSTAKRRTCFGASCWGCVVAGAATVSERGLQKSAS